MKPEQIKAGENYSHYTIGGRLVIRRVGRIFDSHYGKHVEFAEFRCGRESNQLSRIMLKCFARHAQSKCTKEGEPIYNEWSYEI